jgi:hypothetical protein
MNREDTGNYFARTIKSTLESLSGSDINTVLTSKTVKTDSLCIAGTCYQSGEIVTSDTLRTALSQSAPVVNNYTTVVQEVATPEVSNSGQALSEEDQSVLGMLRSSLNSLFVEIRTVFTELVTFTRSVIFESLVTFKDKVIFEARVTFSDPDMAGTATISAGTDTVHVEFSRPYGVKPIVTIAATGHYKL